MIGWFRRKRNAPVATADHEGTLSLLEQGLLHHREGRLGEAEQAYRELLAADAQNVDAMHFIGVIAFQRGEYDRAKEWITRALQRNDRNAAAQNNLGNVFKAQGRLEDAAARYRRAIEMAPHYVDAHVNLADTLAQGGAAGQAAEHYRKACDLAPGVESLRYKLGNVLATDDRLEQAIASYREAIALKPDFFEAHLNLGRALKQCGRLEEAIAAYEEAVRRKRQTPAGHLSLGMALLDSGQRGRARDAFERAAALDPQLADPHYLLGHLHNDEDRREEALASLRKALELQPEYPEARWAYAMSQLQAVHDSSEGPARCRTAFEADLTELERWFGDRRNAFGERTVGNQQPFRLAYDEENNRELLARYGALCVRLMTEWSRRNFLPRPEPRLDGGRIKVAVVSRYFYDHSVWNALARGWFQHFDRQRFELIAVCLGSEHDDETRFAQSHADAIVQGLRGLRQWADTILALRADALIYPEIGMDPMTQRLACLRMAPVQVAAWGHPETTGLPSIDYYLSAEDLEPPGAQGNYTERLVELPKLGCTLEARPIEPVAPSLATCGIDPRVPLLICPGTPFKYAPRHDWVFPEIARRLGRCRFAFFNHPIAGLSARLERRLQATFAEAGIDFARHVTFLPWLPLSQFYGLMQRADVYLDTIGFSGFNTALQALECGLPIVTREGGFLRGRLASGLLKRVGAPELVVADEEEYVSRAVRLVDDADYSEKISARIESAREALYRDLAPVRSLEEFLETVVPGR